MADNERDPAPGPIRDIHGDEPTAQIDADHRDRNHRPARRNVAPEVAAMRVDSDPDFDPEAALKPRTRAQRFEEIDDRAAAEAANDVRRREHSAD